MEYFGKGSPETALTAADAGQLLDHLLEQLRPMNRVLLVPPDFTRFHSGSGALTVMLYERLSRSVHVEIMPALGTHTAMTAEQITAMFPGIPADVFRAHDWRNDLVRLGEVPGDYISAISEGRLAWPISCEINCLLAGGNWDRIISIGQLVPHEVAGIANHNKNIFVGVGGADTINRTHYLGAVHGMERIMGRAVTPVRAVFDYMSEHFARHLPIVYLLTVRARDEGGRLVTRGLFAGDDQACFRRGARLCQQVSLDLLDAPIRKAVVYLDPAEYKSAWLGNKAIYRTRMAMADEGELVILAPGVREFGEDAAIDALIRKYGYRGTPHTLRMAEENGDLRANLSAAAHLIHGSSEGRFRIVYCAGGLSRNEVKGAGFEYADPAMMMNAYPPDRLRNGYNKTPGGGEIFFIPNPGLGLWALKSQFERPSGLCPVLVVMGVTGCGKTTLGQALADAFGLPFHDADEFHTPDNRRKLLADIPLDDDDRRPWLETLAGKITGWERSGGAVLACSALKESYRRILRTGSTRAVFVYVQGEKDVIARRLEARAGAGHMLIRNYERILDGQFRDLEEPADAVMVSNLISPEAMAEAALQQLRGRGVIPFI
ncbi:MAG: gluconokinase, GntK/IdnK-type [Candidatus Sumerlaeota bacterium]|nr:gluconokinase, GntK/IdnK-type [Candidatus Sumerlaeota bacterium]